VVVVAHGSAPWTRKIATESIYVRHAHATPTRVDARAHMRVDAHL
jgi:hypothetical protein